ncbi:hypothetical protein DPMN_070630 [Dreissena polymorpha]|uniref:Uncharacterized protein n=1 Tax=Dreissena polymorpha TaxID=45954 RepID=A0A9D3Z5T3_DREPO|nr:hypothetical protein DPMN_070630 [Dreissena polymorpha]
MYPPFSLLPRVLQKITQDAAEVVLVCPLWSSSETGVEIQKKILIGILLKKDSFSEWKDFYESKSSNDNSSVFHTVDGVESDFDHLVFPKKSLTMITWCFLRRV